MAKLRRLNAREVIAILEQLGFKIIRIKGSHHRMMMKYGDITCFTTVPMHGSKPLSTGTLKAIYRQASGCVPEEIIYAHFYSE